MTGLRNSAIGSLDCWQATAERHRSLDEQPPKDTICTVAETVLREKPLVSRGGIDVSISLTESVLFLQGFQQRHSSERSTAVLRGSLHLVITRPVKIKAVTLKFCGKIVTQWPEGIPPQRNKFEETDTIMNHTWPFFNAQFQTTATGSGPDHVELFKTSLGSVHAGKGLFVSPARNLSTNLSLMKANWLSLQANPSHGFGKSQSTNNEPSIAQKGYGTFNPAEYVFSFEQLLDSCLPETIETKHGSVKYELKAIVERAGPFRGNLVGSKEVTLIRIPAEDSLERIEPIAVTRTWYDRLRYRIIVSGKSFQLGEQVPIIIKFTPLAKVECHWIKVFAIEHIEYVSSNKRARRMEPVRKVQLFEEGADNPSTDGFAGDFRQTGFSGGVFCDKRSAGLGMQTQEPTKLLASLTDDFGVGSTEIKFNVRLPSYASMKHNHEPPGLHFDTMYQNIKVHHWIRIAIRLSRPDENNPNRMRHFEIFVEAPIRILSCHATVANTVLPAYRGLTLNATDGTNTLPDQ